MLVFFYSVCKQRQDIILHDSVSKRASAFFQLSSGLSILGFLEIIKIFPGTFEKHFVHAKNDDLTPEMIKEALICPCEPIEVESSYHYAVPVH